MRVHWIIITIIGKVQFDAVSNWSKKKKHFISPTSKAPKRTVAKNMNDKFAQQRRRACWVGLGKNEKNI